MKNKGKIIIFFFALLAAGTIFWAVKTVPQPVVETNAPAEDKPMTYAGNTIKEEKNGVKLWELTSEQIVVDPKTGDLDLKNISGKFYQSNGTVVSIAAPHAFYQVQEKNVKIDGGVLVETSEGAKMKSKVLDWEAAKEMLTGSGDVQITKEDTIAVGDKIESKDGFQNFKLMGNAHITKGRSQ